MALRDFTKLTLETRTTGFDDFIFHDIYNYYSISTPYVSNPFEDALLARNQSQLDHNQKGIFSEALYLIETINSLGLETADAIQDYFGDSFEFETVKDLSTTSGEELRGIATENGRILIDSDLTGEELREVLTEEIAESAYYSAFGSSSAGDFGAEVVYRMNGGSDEQKLENLRTASQDDTVQTVWGTGQASISPAALNRYSKELDLGDEYILGAPVRYFYSETGSVRPSDQLNPGNLVPQFAEATLREYRSDLDLNTFVRTASGYDTSLVDFSGLNNGTTTDSLGIGSMDFDMNRDGKKDIFDYVGSLNHQTFHGSQSPLSIKGLSGADLTATDNASRVYVGQGSVTSTWTVSESETHSTSKNFNYNESIATAVKGSGSFGPFSFGTDVTVTGNSGNGTTNGNSFGVTKTVSHSYTIAAGSYEPGTLVSYGFHMLTADILIEEEFVAVLEITNADKPTYLFVDVQVEDTVQDHALGLVLSDYSVFDQPNFDNMFLA